MNQRRVAVIGGGAAGMMAAVFGAKKGDAVTVFEKNAKIGRKLYITGKGRCNLTNCCDAKTVIENVPTNGRFLYSALRRFSPEDTMRFFEENGLSLKVERGNRVFPVSDKAADVVDTLLKAAKQEGVRIVFRQVQDVVIENGAVKGVLVGGKMLPFDKVIIASGGCSYPKTGSTGDGYRFAETAGHTIIPLTPSLVPLETVEMIDREASGLLLKNIGLTVQDTAKENKTIYTDFGELQLMHYGVSGAVILSASAHIKEIISGRYRLLLDLKPALSEEKLNARLLREIGNRKKENVFSLMRSLLPEVMIPLMLRITQVSKEKGCSEITKEERMKILCCLKALPLTVSAARPIEEAIVTSGGVCVKEIDPKTMRSKLCMGLYFAGEVIDVDAYTGGFNLQCAFATGVLAGEG